MGAKSSKHDSNKAHSTKNEPQSEKRRTKFKVLVAGLRGVGKVSFFLFKFSAILFSALYSLS